MPKFIGFGSGRHGLVPASGTPNSYAVVTGSAGSQQVNTTLSVSVGDLVMLMQMYGAGNFEFVSVSAVGVNQFTSATQLDYTYGSSCQAIKVFEASGGTITGNLIPTAWNGSLGGLGVIFCGGKITISGNVLANGYGYRGGNGSGNCVCGSNPSYSGEGTAGLQVFGSLSPGGNAGGGSNGNGMDGAPGGGGGGYGTTGQQGGNEQNGTGGFGGAIVGDSALTTLHMGGGGGGGRGEKNGNGNGGTGGRGGGGWIIFAKEIVVTSTGVINCDGATGNGASGSSSEGGGGGGGGAGGFIWLKAGFITLANASNIVARGGNGGSRSGTGPAGNGGRGGDGRIRLEACRITIQSGGTNPGASTLQGGFNFCGSLASMLE